MKIIKSYYINKNMFNEFYNFEKKNIPENIKDQKFSLIFPNNNLKINDNNELVENIENHIKILNSNINKR